MFIVNKSKKVINITIPTGTKRIMANSYIVEHGTYHRHTIEEIVGIYEGNLVVVNTEQEALDMLEEEETKPEGDITIVHNAETTIILDNTGSISITAPVVNLATEEETTDTPDDFNEDSDVDVTDINDFLVKLGELSVETKADLLKDIEENPEAVIDRVSERLYKTNTEEQVEKIKEELRKIPSVILDPVRFNELLDSVNLSDDEKLKKLQDINDTLDGNLKEPQKETIESILALQISDEDKLVKIRIVADNLGIKYSPQAGIKNIIKKIREIQK